MKQEKTLVIEFTASARRNREYERTDSPIDVLYVGAAAPVSVRFAWEQIGVRHSGRPRNRLFQTLALGHALDNADAARWVAVCPPALLIPFLARRAAAADIPLTLWIDETDSIGWFLFLVSRATGSDAEAIFLEDGWDILSHHGRQSEEAA